MKIAVFDSNLFKFTRDMMDCWRAQGHEVRNRYTFHLPDAEWADLLWFDCVDGNLVLASTQYYDLLKNKRVIARGIDIDIWVGHFGRVDWSVVGDLIFIARHIKENAMSRYNFPEGLRIHHIPCGVDLRRITMRQNPVRNNKIAVVMRLWHGKGIDYLLQLALMMPDYEFHVLGKDGMENWYRAYFQHIAPPNLIRTAHVDDINAWYEDKSVILVTSKKEAFSYAAAEGMAKGLKPVIHDFYGAADIWPDEYRWRVLCEAKRMIKGGDYNPDEYRAYIADNYSLETMMQEINEVCFG